MRPTGVPPAPPSNAAASGPLQGRLVFGENVAQAAQFALSGSAQGGIVAWSLVKAPELARQASQR
jgi:hypothetical protein